MNPISEFGAMIWACLCWPFWKFHVWREERADRKYKEALLAEHLDNSKPVEKKEE